MMYDLRGSYSAPHESDSSIRNRHNRPLNGQKRQSSRELGGRWLPKASLPADREVGFQQPRRADVPLGVGIQQPKRVDVPLRVGFKQRRRTDEPPGAGPQPENRSRAPRGRRGALPPGTVTARSQSPGRPRLRSKTWPATTTTTPMRSATVERRSMKNH
ncbi:uncharacterized protein LOC110182626 [Drosophila serrata]|uniref:uncharacterized protein LOC110182626 n=1 Tax=Drosophila serrata TaxID=7274 RepID=UPI000A1D238F|nr:uncharacterized protein LOC110182626 [Drosophila serrata]